MIRQLIVLDQFNTILIQLHRFRVRGPPIAAEKWEKREVNICSSFVFLNFLFWRINSRVEGWRNGRLEGWNNGRLEREIVGMRGRLNVGTWKRLNVRPMIVSDCMVVTLHSSTMMWNLNLTGKVLGFQGQSYKFPP